NEGHHARSAKRIQAKQRNRLAFTFIIFRHRDFLADTRDLQKITSAPLRLSLKTFLAESVDRRYMRPIEFRPDDLASPRFTRRTDDPLPKSRSPSRLCDSAAIQT